MEENAKNEELSEVEEKLHVKIEEKCLSCSHNRYFFIEKNSRYIFYLPSLWEEFLKQAKS